MLVRLSVVIDFDSYVAERADGLLRYATTVAADAHTAQDIVQAVLERAYQRWDKICLVDHPDAYLRRMVVNEFISTRRRIGRLLLVGRLHDPGVVPDHSIQLSDRVMLIAKLRKLPPRQRAAVALRYWDGLSDAQIADHLGCSEGTVRGYIHRALKRLRLELDVGADGTGGIGDRDRVTELRELWK